MLTLFLHLALLAILGLSQPLVCPDGSVLEPSDWCPINITLPNLWPQCDQVALGEICEGDGECGTDENLNNCDGSWDIYRKTASTTTSSTGLPCSPPIAGNGLKVAFSEVTELAMCKHLSPPMTDDFMAERCNSFCMVQGEQRGIPLLIGSETYGLPLKDVNAICLGVSGTNENLLISAATEIEFCRANLGVLRDIKVQAVHFVARVEVFRAEGLAFRAEMLNRSRLLQDELMSPQFKLQLDLAIDKPGLLKKRFREFSELAQEKSAGSSGLGQAIEQLRQSANDLALAMDDNLRQFQEFVSRCDALVLGIGSQQEYAYAICSQLNGACLDNDRSGHVTCCCGVNPLSVDSLTIDGLESVDGRVAEGRRLDSSPGEVDVCAQAKTESRAERELAHARIRHYGHQELLEERQSQLQEAYPGYYSHCSSRRLGSRPDRRLNQDGGAKEVGSCDLPPPHAGTGLGVAFTRWTNQDLCKYTVPPVTDAAMAEQCVDFCKPTGVAMLMGTSTYGFSLEEANSICLPPEGVLVYNVTHQQQCSTWSGAFVTIEAAASEFIAKLDIFEAARVLYLADTRYATHQIQAYLRSDEFKRTIDFAENKMETLRETIKSRIATISGQSVRTSLSEAVRELKNAMTNLKGVLQLNLAQVENFLSQCNQLQVGRGFHDEYLLDICAMQNGRCIDSSGSGHVSCCCAVNPIAAMSGPLTSTVTIDGIKNIEGGRAKGGNTGGGRRVAAEAFGKTVDMCAQAWTEARPHVLRIRAEVEAIGHGDLVIQEVAKLRERYGQQYCAYVAEDNGDTDGSGDNTAGNDSASGGGGGDGAGGEDTNGDKRGADDSAWEDTDEGADKRLSTALVGTVVWNGLFRS